MKSMLRSMVICTVLCGHIYVVEPEMFDALDTVDTLHELHPAPKKSLLHVPELDDLKSVKTKLQSPLKSAKNSQPAHPFDLEEADWSLLDSHEDLMRKALKSLPPKNQPADINEAMQMIHAGKKVFDALSEGKFYDAIALHLPATKALTQDQKYVQQIASSVFNADDQAFWEMIKHDPVIAKKVASQNIPFTIHSLMSPEFNMYFRLEYLREHIQNQVMLEDFKKAYQKSLVDLQWHLFAKSIEQDPIFTSGMITFEDPKARIFSFMDGYAELVSPKYKFHSALGLHSLWADQAYNRESSHWNGQKAFDGKNFGIDIKSVDGKLLSVLPDQKSHLLFGMRTNGMTFVKWEEYGTTFNIKAGDYSVIHHTMRYFSKKGQEDDPDLQRREKLPKVVLERFKSLYKNPLTAAQKTLIESDGIAELIRILDQQAPSQAKVFKDFLTKQMGYQPDSLSVRKGGEVILHLWPPQKTVPTVQAAQMSLHDL